jgi:hypothetical protein
VPINYIGHAEKWDDLDIEGNIESRDCVVRYRRRRFIRSPRQRARVAFAAQ